ncbi:MAG: hypothetical protein FJ291_25265 [Planctomycetes bacterium]|nr:hypothetical protein [Planctomycetota bacterium]
MTRKRFAHVGDEWMGGWMPDNHPFIQPSNHPVWLRPPAALRSQRKHDVERLGGFRGDDGAPAAEPHPLPRGVHRRPAEAGGGARRHGGHRGALRLLPLGRPRPEAASGDAAARLLAILGGGEAARGDDLRRPRRGDGARALLPLLGLHLAAPQRRRPQGHRGLPS